MYIESIFDCIKGRNYVQVEFPNYGVFCVF